MPQHDLVFKTTACKEMLTRVSCQKSQELS